MADNNNLNRDDDVMVAADDPFAELARLMSQESGQQAPAEEPARPEPVAKAANEAPPVPAPALVPETKADPFAVDLEKELLGGLEDIDAAFAAEPEEPVVETAEPDFEPHAELSTPEETEEPDIWADDELAGSADDPYAADVSAEQDVAEPVAQDDDSMLAEVDLDFGDLDLQAEDTPAEEHVEESVAEELPVETPAAEPFAEEEAVAAGAATPVDDTLEDELEMLLTGGLPEPEIPAREPVAETYARQDGAVAEAAARLGRANFAGAHTATAAEPTVELPEAEELPEADELPPVDHADAAEPAAAEEAAKPAFNDDPFADLAEIMAKSSVGIPEPAEQPAAAIDIDTVDVPETAFEQADDLDLPELPADEPAPAHPDDEFETELGYDFQPATESAPEQPATQSAGDVSNPDDEDRFYAEALGLGTAAAGAGAYAATTAYQRPENIAGDDINLDLDDAVAGPGEYADDEREERGNRNGFLIAAAVVGVALIGGIGAFALSFGGGGDSETPVLVQADTDPVKVKPESPGGAAVPNQDSAAHEAASGAGSTEPQQESLVSTTEEPVNLASRTVGTGQAPGVEPNAAGEGDTAAVKSEERLAPSASDSGGELANDVIAVQPRRVRTMIVRPDGTLVAREDPPAPAPVTEAAAQPAPAVETTQPVRQIETTQPTATQPAVAETQDTGSPTTEPAQPETVAAAQTPATETPATEPAATEEVAAVATANDPVTPSVGPVATPRPADQQTTTQPQQVAQAAPAARTEPAAPAPAPVVVQEDSTWSMQIASQPTAESAQATYQDLARRYGELLGGRGVNIVRAEIPGKGTYFRVRIPTSSRADGIALCERYKAIGGSCFVSK